MNLTDTDLFFASFQPDLVLADSEEWLPWRSDEFGDLGHFDSDPATHTTGNHFDLEPRSTAPLAPHFILNGFQEHPGTFLPTNPAHGRYGQGINTAHTISASYSQQTAAFATSPPRGPTDHANPPPGSRDRETVALMNFPDIEVGCHILQAGATLDSLRDNEMLSDYADPIALNPTYASLYDDNLDIKPNAAEGEKITAVLGLTNPISQAMNVTNRRTKISPSAKAVLETQFHSNAYPSHSEISLLSSATRLEARSIKNWFTNARSRRTVPKKINSTINNSRKDGHLKDRETKRSTSQRSNLSAASLDELNRRSPAARNTSLQRYLQIPSSEEHNSNCFIKGLTGNQCEMCGMSFGEDATFLEHLSEHQNSAPQRPYTPKLFVSKHQQAILEEASVNMEIRPIEHLDHDSENAFSLVASESSVSSCNSMYSRARFRSIDSRGSRRGRRRWSNFHPYGQTNMPKPPAIASIHSPAPANPRRNSLFCTWPGCEATFRYRYDWARHEEAVHYCPYYWICCSEQANTKKLGSCFICKKTNLTYEHMIRYHFRSCAGRDRNERTFLRSDQLSQHINRVHLGTSAKNRVPKDLLQAWRIFNTPLPKATLYCGFCGWSFPSWATRQEHVYEHLQRGATKDMWESEEEDFSSEGVTEDDDSEVNWEDDPADHEETRTGQIESSDCQVPFALACSDKVNFRL